MEISDDHPARSGDGMKLATVGKVVLFQSYTVWKSVGVRRQYSSPPSATVAAIPAAPSMKPTKNGPSSSLPPKYRELFPLVLPTDGLVGSDVSGPWKVTTTMSGNCATMACMI